MKPISVPDMMCENCVRRITEALTKEYLKFEVFSGEKECDGGRRRESREDRHRRAGGSGLYAHLKLQNGRSKSGCAHFTLPCKPFGTQRPRAEAKLPPSVNSDWVNGYTLR